MVKRGSVVAYWREPDVPLKVISEPYDFNGEKTVTAQKVARKKADRKQALYRVSALVPYTEKKKG